MKIAMFSQDASVFGVLREQARDPSRWRDTAGACKKRKGISDQFLTPRVGRWLNNDHDPRTLVVNVENVGYKTTVCHGIASCPY